MDKETEKEFLDNMTYLWGGVTRSKEKNNEALAWVTKQIAKAHRAGREEMIEKITKTLPKKDPQYLRKLNSETEATWDERAERGKVNYNYGWNDLLDKFNELLKKEF